jgi:hypothetical protein
MKTIYITLIIGILLIGIIGAVSLLPKQDAIIRLDKATNKECQTKFILDGREYTLHFTGDENTTLDNRNKALKGALEQDDLYNKINQKDKEITSINITSTICGGIETLGEGKVTIEK